ncbi:Hypothetical predicted protein [Pelobates cultripes]|uniref:Uncharacterized protein n=1 Tax=Pelobates cultripes TaxID=61616 RepID=A0AAD1R7X9_PELCU|nr:Hypothetical predicted protein [Pelobates cultripes]
MAHPTWRTHPPGCIWRRAPVFFRGTTFIKQKLQDKCLLPVTRHPKSLLPAQIPQNPSNRHVVQGPATASSGKDCNAVTWKSAVHTQDGQESSHPDGNTPWNADFPPTSAPSSRYYFSGIHTAELDN